MLTVNPLKGRTERNDQFCSHSAHGSHFTEDREGRVHMEWVNDKKVGLSLFHSST